MVYILYTALAHFMSWTILIWYGWKHKYPIVQWLLIIITGYTSFTIGAHLLAVDVGSVKLAISAGGWPETSGKTFIGGLLIAVPAMLLVKRLLKFENVIFEPYAFTIPLGIAVQRVGCLVAGCCYGKPTSLPWGISYSFGQPAHYAQWEQGHLYLNQWQSLAVHPVQVYESILCLMVLGIMVYFYKKQWLKYQLIFVFLFLYTTIRFITEFFRADAAHTLGQQIYLGLNTVQWIMLMAGTIFLVVTLNKSRLTGTNRPIRDFSKGISLAHVIWYIGIFLLVTFSQQSFASYEQLLLGILLIPLSALVFWRLLSIITVPKFRMATVAMLVVTMFLVSQTSLENEKDAISGKFHEFSLGGYFGSNELTTFGRSCDGTKTPYNTYNEKYYLAGLGYKFVNQFADDEKLTLGVFAGYGNLEEEFVGTDISWQQDIYSFSPFVQYDMTKLGFGFGLNIGDNSVIRGEDYNAPLTLYKRFRLLPMAHLRVGNLNKTWGEFNYAYRFPGFSPANEYEFLIGFRGPQGNSVRIGTAAFSGLVIRPKFYVKNSFGIEPYFGIGGPMFSNSYMNRKGVQAGLNLHFRVPQK